MAPLRPREVGEHPEKATAASGRATAPAAVRFSPLSARLSALSSPVLPRREGIRGSDSLRRTGSGAGLGRSGPWIGVGAGVSAGAGPRRVHERKEHLLTALVLAGTGGAEQRFGLLFPPALPADRFGRGTEAHSCRGGSLRASRRTGPPACATRSTATTRTQSVVELPPSYVYRRRLPLSRIAERRVRRSMPNFPSALRKAASRSVDAMRGFLSGLEAADSPADRRAREAEPGGRGPGACGTFTINI